MQLVVGLEIHIQLGTERKVFAPEGYRFGVPPNHGISPVTLAHPGTLPVPNAVALQSAYRLGLALNCALESAPKFDRKHYFYPDSPKGYQLTQDVAPCCGPGQLEVPLADGSIQKIRINRIHLEEDAGKSMHDELPYHSLVDLNRAGVPLLELVTEPDFRDVETVAAFVREIRRLVVFLGVSDGDMEKGNLRVDANVSLRPNSDAAFGTRVEIKNLNSLRSLRRAIGFEQKRQQKLLAVGEAVIQQTRNYDPDRDATFPLRDKEEADDYRYFPDPDQPPLRFDAVYFDALRAAQPTLPLEIYHEARTDGLDHGRAMDVSASPAVAVQFAELKAAGLDAISAANWLLGPMRRWEKANEGQKFPLEASQVAALLAKVEAKALPLSVARDTVFDAWAAAPDKPLDKIIADLDLGAGVGKDALAEAVAALFAEFPDECARLQAGEKKLIGFFIGQLKRRLGPNFDPASARAALG